jgi:hypothetical protein
MANYLTPNVLPLASVLSLLAPTSDLVHDIIYVVAILYSPCTEGFKCHTILTLLL